MNRELRNARRIVWIAAILLGAAIALAVAGPARECRRAATPAECVACCLEERPERMPRERAEHICKAICRNIAQQPPSESKP